MDCAMALPFASGPVGAAGRRSAGVPDAARGGSDDGAAGNIEFARKPQSAVLRLQQPRATLDRARGPDEAFEGSGGIMHSFLDIACGGHYDLAGRPRALARAFTINYIRC